jgi:predicted O-methyltransferase YrrM
MAEALPVAGRLIACDVSEAWTTVARRYWKRAGVAHKIDLRLGPAMKTLDALLKARRRGTFDLAFIDADKTAYDGYYERCLELVRPGGIIALDNALWGGTVTRRKFLGPDSAALHALNQKVRVDPRVDACLLTVGDGLLIAQRRIVSK